LFWRPSLNVPPPLAAEDATMMTRSVELFRQPAGSFLLIEVAHAVSFIADMLEV
jgi:hypothetical protein